MNARPGGSVFLLIAGVAVAASVAAALYVLGSPAHQRDMRLDERRAGDLGRLDSAIGEFWKSEGHLPARLAELPTANGGMTLKDPQTGAPYGYRAIDTRHYALCAVFATDNRHDDDRNEDAIGYFGRQWTHPAGRHCFVQSTSKVDEAILEQGKPATVGGPDSRSP